MDALKVMEEENCTEFQLMVVEWEQFNVIITVFCVNKTLLLVQRILWLSVPLPSLGILYGDKMPILRSHQIAITTNQWMLYNVWYQNTIQITIIINAIKSTLIVYLIQFRYMAIRFHCSRSIGRFSDIFSFIPRLLCLLLCLWYVFSLFFGILCSIRWNR